MMIPPKARMTIPSSLFVNFWGSDKNPSETYILYIALQIYFFSAGLYGEIDSCIKSDPYPLPSV